MIIQFFKIKNFNLNLAVLNDKEYKIIRYNKLVYYKIFLKSKKYVRKIITIYYY